MLLIMANATPIMSFFVLVIEESYLNVRNYRDSFALVKSYSNSFKIVSKYVDAHFAPSRAAFKKDKPAESKANEHSMPGVYTANKVIEIASTHRNRGGKSCSE